MTEFPFLIFRKVCYFCQDFDHEAHECVKYDDTGDDTPACSEFVLSSEYARFLDTEIFDEVEKAWKAKQKEVEL